MNESDVRLVASHILLENNIVERVFQQVQFALIVYNKEENTLLVSPVSNAWFKKMHKGAAQFMLKTKNMNGDKSLSIREVLIDNDIDDVDRDLDFKVIEKTKLVKIKM